MMLSRRVYLVMVGLAAAAALMLGACAGAVPARLLTADVAASGGGAVVADPLIEIRGTLESVDTSSISVAGKVVAIVPETELKGMFVAGDMVKVQAAITSAGDLVAREVAPLGVESGSVGDSTSHSEFTGLVESIAPDSWTVGGTVLAITPDTEIKDAIQVGDLVKVEAMLGTGGVQTATEIKLAASEDNTGEEESGKVEFTGLVETIAADTWTVDGKALAITLDTEIKDGIKVGDLVKVEAMAGTDGALTATDIKLAEAEDQGQDSQADDLEFSGVVESIAADMWTVGGKAFVVTSETEIKGTIQVGDSVKVEAKPGTDGALVADEIHLTTDTGSGNTSDSGDDHSGHSHTSNNDTGNHGSGSGDD